MNSSCDCLFSKYNALGIVVKVLHMWPCYTCTSDDLDLNLGEVAHIGIYGALPYIEMV